MRSSVVGQSAGRAVALYPAAYGLDRPPMPLPAIQRLLDHADSATIYTRISADDFACMMGMPEGP
jgi:hypothetical protein